MGVVLRHVAAGRSPWTGWDAGQAARTGENHDTYAARAEVIRACRAKGLLGEDGLLTDDGLKALKLREATVG